MPLIASIQVGRPRELGDEHAREPFDQPWTTSFFKTPVSGPVHVSFTNVEGDEQADLEVHGGPDKAICVYSGDHFPYWAERLGHAIPPGAFGENFTVADLIESGICIGDVWEAGGVQVQVSQPRQPCWKLARRWRIKDLTAQVQATGRTGWYFRVLREGQLQSGDVLTLMERPAPEWTIERANDVMYRRRRGRGAEEALAAVPALSESWRDYLLHRSQHASR
jgi:MOSC domain-containing protein YiiM